MPLPDEVRSLLCCPACHGALRWESQRAACTAESCGRAYPISDGVPILIDPDRSVFTFEDFLQKRPTFFKPVGRLRELGSRLLPTLDQNITSRRNYAQLRDLLKARKNRPRVLVIGGGIVGDGMEALVDDPDIELVETDVSLGPRTQIVCDAHDLPIKDGSVDAVVAQAVLEHVLDPQRCVDEMHRVLTERGLVYADTPMMVQVHGREFDFTRFTYLGHRRLFRRFAELAGGITCGPGMALAWTLRYFLLSFFTSRPLRAVVSGLSRCAFFWLKYFDYFLVNKKSAYDAALAFFLLGEKREQAISDRDLIRSYTGGF